MGTRRERVRRDLERSDGQELDQNLNIEWLGFTFRGQVHNIWGVAMRSVRRSVFVVASLVAASTLIGQPAGAAPPPTPEVPSGSAAAAATEASTAAPSPADRPIFSLVVSTGANSIVVTSDTPLPDEARRPLSSRCRAR